MRTSFFALATSLLFAAFVSASPIEGSLAIEKRCNDGSCCASHEFWYKPKSCCLTSGGPPKTNTPNPPSGKGCPNNWYWHTGHKCCTPRNPPSNPSNPNPTCNSSTFPRWDFGDHCCKSNPPSGSNPPGPNPSHRPQREARQPKSKYAKHARKLTEREAKCPTDTEYCPGQGCFESFNNLESCGGCPGAGGQDCEAIPNVLSVGCEASGVTSSCVVFSCDDGFKPSADRKSCEAE